MLRAKKILPLLFLISIGLSLVSPALALELKYPSLPGIGSLNQVEQLPKEEQMGFYIKYFVNLFFFIVAGVCAVVLITGGILYIAASQKAGAIIQAKELIKNAFLGLFILISSYLVLYAINPQLLVFRTDLKPLTPSSAMGGAAPEAKITFSAVDLNQNVTNILDHFEEKVLVDEETGQIIGEEPGLTALSLPKKGFFASLTSVLFSQTSQTPPPGTLVRRVEVSFFRTKKILEQALKVLKGVHQPEGCTIGSKNCVVSEPGLTDLMLGCQCGWSYDHTKKESTFEFVCKGGMEEGDAKALMNEIKDNKAIQKSQKSCLTKCDFCSIKKDGTMFKGVIGEDGKPYNPEAQPSAPNQPDSSQAFLFCDLREVKEVPYQGPNQDDDKDDTKAIRIQIDPKKDDPESDGWATIETYYFDNGEKRWKWRTEPGGDDYKKTSIKYKRLKLLQLLAELEGQRPKFSTDRIDALAKVLKLNTNDFLAGETQRNYFSSVFEVTGKILQQNQVGVEVKTPEQFAVPPAGQTSQISRSEIKDQNLFSLFFEGAKNFLGLFEPALAVGEAAYGFSAATLFYPIEVENFPQLSLEWADYLKVNQAVEKEATRANLYSVLAELTLEEIERMFQECLGSALGEAEYDIDKYNVKEIIRQAIQQGTADYVVLKFSQNSQEFADFVGDEIIDDINNEVAGTLKKRCTNQQCANECNSAPDSDDCKKCVDQCLKENIPPHFLSNKLGEIITEPLKKRLPDEIEKLLDKELRNVIFEESGKINQALGSEMVKLYDNILGGALKNSFTKQIPALKKVLDTNIRDWVGANTGGFLGKIDRFLNIRVDELRTIINKKSEELVKGLGDALGNGIEAGMDKLKKEMPQVFSEFLDIEDCFGELRKGRLFKCSEGKDKCDDIISFSRNSEKYKKVTSGRCVEMTVDEINSLEKAPSNIEEDRAPYLPPEAPTTDFLLKSFAVVEEEKAKICEGAGYCWSQDWEINDIHEGRVKGPWQCGDCQIAGQATYNKIKSAESVGDALKDAAKKGVGFVVNYGQEMLVALTKIITHTALAYAQVWVEDNILIPLEPYIRQVAGFQDSLRKFLNSTVADVLPQQVVNTLNSNAETIIGDICDLKDKPQAERAIALDLYSKKTWGGTINFEAPSDQAFDNICRLDTHFHTTLLNEIKASGGLGEKIANALTTKMQEFLGETANKYLKMSPAAIIFEQYGIEDINKLIQGRPKQLLCGELIKVNTNGDWGLTGPMTVAQKCDELKTVKQKALGTFPYLNEDKLKTEKYPDRYKFACRLIWGACQNPTLYLPAIGQPISALVNSLLPYVCELKDDPQKKAECQAKVQALLTNSLAFSTFYYAIEKDFGPVSERTPQKEEKEKEIYEWLLTYFPLLQGEIQKVAVKRELASAWPQILQRQRDIEHINNFAGMDAESWLRALVAWRIKGKTVEDILTEIPLGVIKPAKKGDATILKEAGQGEEKNFLTRTPYQFLYGDACAKVKKEFKEQYPDWTYEAVSNKEAQGTGVALPYSMEALEKSTIAKNLEIILNSSVSDEVKIPYLTCLYLDFTPAQIFGIDQELIYYLRPKEYQILFQLIDQELHDEEKPEKLKQLLNYLFDKTPVDGLYDIAEKLQPSGVVAPDQFELKFTVSIAKAEGMEQRTKLLGESKLPVRVREKLVSQGFIQDTEIDKVPVYIPSPGEIKVGDKNVLGIVDFRYYILEEPGAHQWGFEVWFNPSRAASLLRDLAEFLETPLKTQLLTRWGSADKRLLDLIFDNAFLEKTLPKVSDKWNEAQTFLNQTPTALLNKYLPYKIPGLPGLNEGLLGLIAKHLTWLGEPYVDTLGKLFGLTDDAYNLFEAGQDVGQQIDKWTVKGQDAVQGAMDTVFLEAPKQIGQFMYEKLAGLFGKEVGQKEGEKMAGKCWEEKDATKCDKNKGQILRMKDGVQECCNMGDALVCEPQCREKEKTTEPCRFSKGEGEIKGRCCYTDKDLIIPFCNKCRRAPSNGQCARQGEEPETRKVAGREINLCCKKTAVKQTLGPPPVENFCCQTVTECVTNKFLEHMEIMKDYLIDGPPVGSLLK